MAPLYQETAPQARGQHVRRRQTRAGRTENLAQSPQAQYDLTKGPFEHYAKATIYNALLKPHGREAVAGGQEEKPDDSSGTAQVAPEVWGAEDVRIDSIEHDKAETSIADWRVRLSSKPAVLVEAIYLGESKREHALGEGSANAY